MSSNRLMQRARNTHESIPTSQRRATLNTERGTVDDSPVSDVLVERRKKKVKLKQNSPAASIGDDKVERRSTRSVSGTTPRNGKTASVTVTTSSRTSSKNCLSTPVGSSSNLQVTRSKKEESLLNKCQDIVWKGFKSKQVPTDDSSVAGRVQGSWASTKASTSSTDGGNRRSSTSASSRTSSSSSVSCHVRPEERQEHRRRHSTSALRSLERGGIRLSPFVKDTLRTKHSRTLSLLHDIDSKEGTEKKATGKKVRFAVSPTGNIEPEVAISPSKLCLTAETIKVLWWTGEERQAMKRRAQRIGLRFLSVTAKYHLAVEQMLSKCRGDMGEGRSQLFFAEKDAIRILIHHDARGLELAMISALNLDSCRHYRRSVKQSVTCVLNAQAMLKCSNLRSSDDDQWQMIATMVHQYSVIATRFARILAEGDARFVRGHYVCDADVESSSQIPGLTEESSLSTSSSSEEYDYLDGSCTI